MDDDVRFELRRVSAHEWLIRDHQHPSNDAESVVACIHMADDDEDEVEVVWLRRTLLPVRYISATAVLDDFRIWQVRRDRSTRPVVIPHLPPPVKP